MPMYRIINNYTESYSKKYINNVNMLSTFETNKWARIFKSEYQQNIKNVNFGTIFQFDDHSVFHLYYHKVVRKNRSDGSAI